MCKKTNSSTLGKNYHYQYFGKDSRKNMYVVIKNFANYLIANKISSVAFLDRSARPAFLGLYTYWKINHRNIPMPSFYFLIQAVLSMYFLLSKIFRSYLGNSMKRKIYHSWYLIRAVILVVQSKQ